MRAIGYLLGKIRRYDRMMLPVMALFTVVSSLYPFLWVLVPARIIAIHEQGLEANILPLVLGAGGMALICSFLMHFLRGNFRMRMNKVRYELIQGLLRYSLHMPYENTLHTKTLDDLSLAKDALVSPQTGAGGMILCMLRIFGQVLAALGFVGLLGSLSPTVMMLVALLVLGSFLINQHAANVDEASWEACVPLDRKGHRILQRALEPAAKKDISMYGLFPLIRRYYSRYAAALLALRSKALMTSHRMTILSAGLDLARDAALYGWLIRQYLNGGLDLAGFYLYTTGVLSFVVIAQEAMADIALMRRESRRFKHYMDLPIDQTQQAHEADRERATVPAAQSGARVELKGLSFRYPGSGRLVLDQLDLVIEPGQRLALVGENGSGKSTLIALLCRLYRPTAGQILVDGRDIWELPERQYRDWLGVVFQDATLLPFSIRDNIAMADAADEARLQKAAELSGIGELAASLPKGYDTSLLRVIDEEGVDLSGGQRQALYLARALYKPDTRLLILDEPTAALDPLRERALYERYAELCEGKTSLFVSHRLASTQFCDRVALLKEGRILEYGSHEALLKLRRDYYALFELQARHYRGEVGA